MKTQDIVRNCGMKQDQGNLAIWDDDTITVVPNDFTSNPSGKKTNRFVKPIVLVNKYDFLDFALADKDLLTTIEHAILEGGSSVTRE